MRQYQQQNNQQFQKQQQSHVTSHKSISLSTKPQNSVVITNKRQFYQNQQPILLDQDEISAQLNPVAQLDDLLSDHFNNQITQKIDKSLLEELQESAVAFIDEGDQDMEFQEDELEDLQNQVRMDQSMQQKIMKDGKIIDQSHKIDIFDEANNQNGEDPNKAIDLSQEKVKQKRVSDDQAIQIMKSLANELKITKNEQTGKNENNFSALYSNNLLKLLLKFTFESIITNKCQEIQFTLNLRKLLKIHNIFENLKEFNMAKSKREGLVFHKHILAKQLIIDIFICMGVHSQQGNGSSKDSPNRSRDGEVIELIDLLERLLDQDEEQTMPCTAGQTIDSLSQEFIVVPYQDVVGKDRQKVKNKKRKSNKKNENDGEEVITSAQDPYQFMYQYMYGNNTGGGLDIPEDTSDIDKDDDQQNHNSQDNDQIKQSQKTDQSQEKIEEGNSFEDKQKQNSQEKEEIANISSNQINLDFIDEFVNSRGFLYFISQHMKLSLKESKSYIEILCPKLKQSCYILSQNLMSTNIEIIRTLSGLVYVNQDLVMKLQNIYTSSENPCHQKEVELFKLRLLMQLLSQAGYHLREFVKNEIENRYLQQQKIKEQKLQNQQIQNSDQYKNEEEDDEEEDEEYTIDRWIHRFQYC
eukprot:403363490